MSLVEAVKLGQRFLVELDRGDPLSAHARQILVVASDEVSAGLIAASPPGERLVGAALAIGDGAVHGWSPGRDTTAVICDVMLSSGDNLKRAARRVRMQGARRVVAVVLANPWGDGATRVPEVDEVFVLQKHSLDLEATEVECTTSYSEDLPFSIAK